jgi:hypothetical protein
VEAGNQPPNVQRIEAHVRVVKIYPGVEPDSHPAAVGDELARPRTSWRRRRNTGGERRLLECRALEQFGEVLIGDIADVFTAQLPRSVSSRQMEPSRPLATGPSESRPHDPRSNTARMDGT